MVIEVYLALKLFVSYVTYLEVLMKLKLLIGFMMNLASLTFSI